MWTCPECMFYATWVIVEEIRPLWYRRVVFTLLLSTMQVYYSTTPAKVFNMRPDTLSIMMHAANVGPHARVLCLDATGGVAAAACAERMGGIGTLCCAHAELSQYPLDCARLLNCAKWLAQSARHCALTELLAARKRINAAEEAATEGRAEKKQKAGHSSCHDAGEQVAAASDLAMEEPSSAPSFTKQPGEKCRLGETEQLKNANGEPCIATERPHPAEVGKAPASDASAAVIQEVQNVDAAAAAETFASENAKEDTQGKQAGASDKPVRTARFASAQLRLGKEIPEGFKIPDVIIAAGTVLLLHGHLSSSTVSQVLEFAGDQKLFRIQQRVY
jgi:hypothetical protein